MISNAVCYVYSLSFFLMTNVHDEAEGKKFEWFHRRSLWYNVKAKELPCVWWFQHWYCLKTWKATAFLVWQRGKLLISWYDSMESLVVFLSLWPGGTHLSETKWNTKEDSCCLYLQSHIGIGRLNPKRVIKWGLLRVCTLTLYHIHIV